MSSYLDGAAFDSLYARRGCTAEDIAGLRKRVYARELTIPLSLHHLEEILLDSRARPELKVAKTKLMLSMGNFRRMTKPCESLLRDDLLAAARSETPRLTIDANTQNILSEGLADLIETDGEELSEELVELLEAARAQRVKLLEQIREIAALTLPRLDSPAAQDECLAEFRARSFARWLGSADLAAPATTAIASRPAAAFIDLAATLSQLSNPAALDSLPHALAALASAGELVSADPVLMSAAQSTRLPIKISNLTAFLSGIRGS